MSAPNLPYTVAEWRKNANEIVRVRLTIFEGHNLLEIRAYFREPCGRYRPSRKGINLSVSHLPAILEALEDARRAARSRGWLQ
ncbi:transcriptional coactivator p15/PC4 family protein [Hyphobacterium lacteum]|uniref:transcriptional coactivator p15/PC4 family protein n=1 Tax=Hyphobacterium lacteum TaxID=3116575 RepID=UPI0035A070D7